MFSGAKKMFPSYSTERFSLTQDLYFFLQEKIVLVARKTNYCGKKKSVVTLSRKHFYGIRNHLWERDREL